MQKTGPWVNLVNCHRIPTTGCVSPQIRAASLHHISPESREKFPWLAGRAVKQLNCHH